MGGIEMVMRKDAHAVLKTGVVRFDFLRSGTASEIQFFLRTLEKAYKKTLTVKLILANTDNYIRFCKEFSPFPRRYAYHFVHQNFICFERFYVGHDIYDEYPESILEIKSIKISSPGFFEFLGSINPLEFIRNFLNDRHNRMMDREFLSLEKEKKRMEVEILKNQVMRERIEMAEDMYDISRKYGIPLDDLERRIVGYISEDFHELGKMQDSKLIE